MASTRGTKRRISTVADSDHENEDEASATPVVLLCGNPFIARDDISLTTKALPLAKRVLTEDARHRYGTYRANLTGFVPAWKRLGLILRPSLSEVLAAKRETASVTSDETLATSGVSSVGQSRACSSPTSSAPPTTAEPLLEHRSSSEVEWEQEEEADGDEDDCTLSEQTLGPVAPQARHRSAKVSVVIPIRSSPMRHDEVTPNRFRSLQSRKEVVDMTANTSVLIYDSPSAPQPRRRSARGVLTLPGPVCFEEKVHENIPTEDSGIPYPKPGIRSHHLSQHRSYIQPALLDPSVEEKKIVEKIKDNANEQINAEEHDQDFRTRLSSRPLRRSTQRVSYTLGDEIASEDNPQDDDVSDFGGSEHGADMDSDEEPVSEEEVFSSEDFRSGSDDDFLQGRAIPEERSDIDEADAVASPVAKPRKKAKSFRPTRQSGAKCGIDLSLPPISNIEDLFEVLVDKALGLGLKEALANTHESAMTINVATIFSGTEAPLLAMQQISNALETKGMPPIQVNHLFSTEIDPIKQGYIERNFHPKILFRDAREFISDDSTTAITAYGGEVEIPRLIDILIAGFVCKDLSNLSTRKKTLNDGGESGDTWKALYTFVKKFRPTVVLIENVKSTIATWTEVKGLWDEIEYECAWHYCDTKDYGLPQTRQRMYMVAINRGLYGKGVEQAAKKWQETMKGLARQCSSPFDVWLPKDLSAQHDYTNLMSESDWVLCKIRYELMRFHMKLGLKHPISQCNVNGSICPPDFANRNFYFSQSSRVYDCFDVAHLVAALEGYDSLHKMVVWDVSQNADRFKTKPGLLPAITPNGCDFVSNKQTALGGAQLLVLQGMPVDKLLLANETPRELQDLAGNAMSTPVIGASLLATLIHCLKGFHQKTAQDMPQSQPFASLKAKIITPKPMKQQTLESSTFTDLDVKKLLKDAKASTQLCVCEGAKDLTRSPVQMCKDCEHTACTNCSGNPGHAYGGTTSREQDLHPTDFIRAWRPLMPARLTFSNFPDLLKYKSLPKKSVNDNDCWQEYAHRVAEAGLNSQCFSISEFLRLDNLWKVLYVSAEATLELHIQGTIEWRIFVKCSKLLPGNSSLREILKQPVARGLVQDSLLEPSWELFIPQTTISTVSVSPGSKETASSWRNRLGLQDFKEESIPTCLNIANSDGKVVQPDLIGRYTLLPNCGTAMGSLYVKKSSHPPVYLFLECDLIGHGDLDSFVFSEDLRRMPYGNARITLARLDCSWRPWKVQNKDKSRVSIIVPGRWVMSKFSLEAKIPPMRISFPLSSLGITNASRGDCSQMVTLLNVRVREHLNTSEFSAFSWALEEAKLKPLYPEWQEFHATAGLAKNCQCAPPFPRILWSVNEKFEASAHEDRKSAAQFERAVKTRPSIFDIKTSAKASGTDINVAINLSVLQHCARSRILNNFTTCSEAWRLLTNHMEAAVTHFPKFYLLSNSGDSLHPGPRRMKLNLTETQSKSLTWMERQEFGIPLTIEEIEEAIHADLGWRLEVRATTTVTLRGGVLADLPSFGKTVTTIALIQNEYEKKEPADIVQENLTHSSNLANLINVAATLIVCPDHIARQWREEFHHFLDEKEYEDDKILLISKYGDLSRLTIKDMQTARIVIVSWRVLAHSAYVSDLAKFAALPEPVMTKGRAFDAWLDYAIEAIPARLKELKESGVLKFKEDTRGKLSDRLIDPEFQAVVPIKIGHGSAYQSYDPSSSKLGGKAAIPIPRQNSTQKSRAYSEAADVNWTAFPTPLLQLFRFNRVVIDEYHYLYTSLDHYPTYAAVKKITAHKRWILSGTPALESFSDVSQIATLLGVKIGRDMWERSSPTPLERRLALDQTEVEKFLSRTQIMSRHWHEARHHRAQAFLDKFARQNAPSLEHIDCIEVLHPVKLGTAHQLVYLELSQHLTSLRMQLKKQKPGKGSKSRPENPRDARVEMSLRKSETAEEALIDAALEFTTEAGDSGLNTLMDTRRKQIEDARVEIYNLLRQANRVQVHSNISTGVYPDMKELFRIKRGLGDGDAALEVSKLLRKAEGAKRVLPMKRKTTDAVKELKRLTGEIYATAQELTTRMRSYRFIESIQLFFPTISDRQWTSERAGCSLPTCSRVISSRFLIDNCGHMVCKACLAARVHADSCPYEGCHVPVQASNLINISELGLSTNGLVGKSFGKKLDEVCQLVKGLPREDQCIVFVSNESTIDTLGHVFTYHQITHHRSSADTIHDFQNMKDPKKMKKVLILALGGVEASGVNLTNANHVIFLSPHLAESQYEYDCQMAQAIARSRRFGQEKKVIIYHFAALRTIDVDILEKRHKRLDGIQEMGRAMQMPHETLGERSKTKLVRNESGHMALVPVCWLKDDAKRAAMNLTDDASFTSLISFSDRYQHGDE